MEVYWRHPRWKPLTVPCFTIWKIYGNFLNRILIRIIAPLSSLCPSPSSLHYTQQSPKAFFSECTKKYYKNLVTDVKKSTDHDEAQNVTRPYGNFAPGYFKHTYFFGCQFKYTWMSSSEIEGRWWLESSTSWKCCNVTFYLQELSHFTSHVTQNTLLLFL